MKIADGLARPLAGLMLEGVNGGPWPIAEAES